MLIFESSCCILCHNHCDHHAINIGVAGDHGDGGHGDSGDDNDIGDHGRGGDDNDIGDHGVGDDHVDKDKGCIEPET